MGSSNTEKANAGRTGPERAARVALVLASCCPLLIPPNLPAQTAPASQSGQSNPASQATTPQQPNTLQQPAQPAPTGPEAQTVPIAIVPVSGVKVTGALEISDGKATVESNGSITAGEHNVQVTLPSRGFLKICPTTKLNLLTDSSVVAGATGKESPGLMMALDRGAFEGYFATRVNSDVILTPGYRVVISGPGIAAVQVRLGDHGDLCVGNGGVNAPYVSVSSIFEGGVYRVNANQRVTFQHGSLNEVVDREKESCGCPPEVPPLDQAAQGKANDFPIAQSEGLAPLPAPPPNALQKGSQGAQATIQLGYSGGKSSGERSTAQAETAPTLQLPKAAKPGSKPGSKPDSNPDQKPGFFRNLGRFFKRIFGG